MELIRVGFFVALCCCCCCFIYFIFQFTHIFAYSSCRRRRRRRRICGNDSGNHTHIYNILFNLTFISGHLLAYERNVQQVSARAQNSYKKEENLCVCVCCCCCLLFLFSILYSICLYSWIVCCRYYELNGKRTLFDTKDMVMVNVWR